MYHFMYGMSFCYGCSLVYHWCFERKKNKCLVGVSLGLVAKGDQISGEFRRGREKLSSSS